MKKTIVKLALMTGMASGVIFGFSQCGKPYCTGEKDEFCICTEEYNPVCGCDGRTYSNTCKAEVCAGVKIVKHEACK